MISTRLWEFKLEHNKEQDTITINWKSNWQNQGCKILQQTRCYNSKTLEGVKEKESYIS